jgi:hypothetical protein
MEKVSSQTVTSTTAALSSNALNVYTRQNPSRHVVLKITSQMRTLCTQIGRDLSACLHLYVSLSPGGFSFKIYNYKYYMEQHLYITKFAKNKI